MRNRILFVDDEINILKAFKRMLRPLRDQWDMVFADGAEKALALLDKTPFEVIVSDMRMPGMDGAALLQTVKQEYPKMIRIILSGHSDQELAMRSVTSAHQYLSKPCEKQALVSAIKRSIALRESLEQPAIQDLIGGIGTMPSLPSLYAKVVAELKSPSASTDSVGRLISDDMGMTAKMLQLVNSSFFGIAGHVSSAHEAVVMLGIDIVKTLVLGMEVFSKAGAGNRSMLPVQAIQDHSVKTGAIAKSIAAMEKMTPAEIDYAAISGILHDLGKLLLMEHFPDQYREVVRVVQKEKIPYYRAETDVFGVTHAQAGAYLLGLWGFPDPVVEAVAHHHCPGNMPSDRFRLFGVVHVADIMAYHEQFQPGAWEKLAGVDHAYLASCRISGRVGLWRDYFRANRPGRQ